MQSHTHEYFFSPPMRERKNENHIRLASTKPHTQFSSTNSLFPPVKFNKNANGMSPRKTFTFRFVSVQKEKEKTRKKKDDNFYMKNEEVLGDECYICRYRHGRKISVPASLFLSSPCPFCCMQNSRRICRSINSSRQNV